MADKPRERGKHETREELALASCLIQLKRSLLFEDVKDILIRDRVLSFDQCDVIEAQVAESYKVSKMIHMMTRSNLKRHFPLFVAALGEADREDMRSRLELAFENAKTDDDGTTDENTQEASEEQETLPVVVKKLSKESSVVKGGMGYENKSVINKNSIISQSWTADCDNEVLSTCALPPGERWAVILGNEVYKQSLEVYDETGDMINSTYTSELDISLACDLVYHPVMDALLVTDQEGDNLGVWVLDPVTLQVRHHYPMRAHLSDAYYISVFSNGDLAITGKNKEGKGMWGVYTADCEPVLGTAGKRVCVISEWHKGFRQVAVGRNDNIVVVDGDGQIHVYKKTGSLMFKLLPVGGGGTISSLCVDKAGHILVARHRDRCVNVYTLGGTLLSQLSLNDVTLSIMSLSINNRLLIATKDPYQSRLNCCEIKSK